MTANVSLNRQIGSVFVVIGTEVGAGILALPLLIANFGFIYGTALMFIIWLLLTYTTFMIAEINLACPEGTSFSGMARRLLGNFGQVMVWLSFLLLLYTISIAYISAAQSAFHSLFKIPPTYAALLFVISLGSFVMAGTAAVDWINRLLLSSKLLLLLYVSLILLPKISLSNLLVIKADRLNMVFATLPVLVTAFTAHIVVPTIRTYLHSNVLAIRRVLLIGSIVPLVLYLIWLMVILGNIPYQGEHSFAVIFRLGDKANVGDMLELLKYNLAENRLMSPLAIFTTISVSTSFLAVCLSLSHFIRDGFKLTRLARVTRAMIILALVFMLPLLMVWLFPNIFIKALGLVGLNCTILLIVIPVAMMHSLRKQNYQFKFALSHKPWLNYLTLSAGIGLIALEIYVLHSSL